MELTVDMNLKSQVELVTGSIRGIGSEIADKLSRLGAEVVGSATIDAGAAAITERLSRINTRSRGARLDVNDGAACESLVQGIAHELGPVSILVNNAGITRDQILLRMKDDDWDAVLSTNLGSVYHLSKCCLRGMMKARNGRIISISSVVSCMGNPGQANYAAAKAGMEGFSRALAREVGSRNITVNVVAPGFIDTDMTRALDETQRAGLINSVPLQRLGQPADIAAAVAFLASPAASYITGQILHVNGGMYM